MQGLRGYLSLHNHASEAMSAGMPDLANDDAIKSLQIELRLLRRRYLVTLALAALAFVVAGVAFIASTGELSVTTTDSSGVKRATRVRAGTIEFTAETRAGTKERVECGAGVFPGPCAYR